VIEVERVRTIVQTVHDAIAASNLRYRLREIDERLAGDPTRTVRSDAGLEHRYRAPPSTRMLCPVTQRASSLARNAATSAISGGVPSRPIGVRATTIASNAGAARTRRSSISVFVGPTKIAFTVMPRGPSSFASTSRSRSRPCPRASRLLQEAPEIGGEPGALGEEEPVGGTRVLDHASVGERQHLVIPHVGVERPPMGEEDARGPEAACGPEAIPQSL